MKSKKTTAPEELYARLSSKNGFERQAAVDELHRLGDASALPQLLVRVNDWVPQVRQAAQSAVHALLVEAFAPHWVCALEAVAALEQAQRADHRALLSAVAAFLSRPALLAKVVQASARASPSVQRYVFALQYDQGPTEQARFRLLHLALAGKEVVLATRAVAQIAAIASPDLQQVLTDAACCSCFSKVRAEALRQALRLFPAAPPRWMGALSLDRSAVVRAIALRALQAQGAAAVDARVADAMARLACPQTAGKKQATALQFVWAARPALARSYSTQGLRSPSATLRRVAFAVRLADLQDGVHQALLLRALADPSAKVQRWVVERVRQGTTPPPASKVLDVAWPHGTVGAIARGFSMVRSCPPWDRLTHLLQTRHRVWPTGSQHLWAAELARWDNDAVRNFVEPTVAQRSTLRTAWTGVAAYLPGPLRQRLQFHLLTSRVLEPDASAAIESNPP